MSKDEEAQQATSVIMGTRRGPGRPPKHGLYSKYVLQPLTETKAKEIIELAKGERLLIAPTDMLAVNLLARVLAQIELMGRWLSENGLFQEDADGHSRGAMSPLLAQYFTAIKVAGQQLQQLGLTTDSRIKLTKGVAVTEDLATKIQRARQE